MHRHLATRAVVRPSLIQPLRQFETNINGTLNLLELAREHNVKQFVFGSSSSVYGTNAKVPFSEDDPIRAANFTVRGTKASGRKCSVIRIKHSYGIRIGVFTVFHGVRRAPAARSRDP